MTREEAIEEALELIVEEETGLFEVAWRFHEAWCDRELEKAEARD
jgi:hypothetical protein